MARKWKIRFVLFLTLLGGIGIFAVIPYGMNFGVYEAQKEVMPFPLLILIQWIQLFVSVLIGVRLQRRTGLRAPILEGIIYKKKKLFISKKWMFIGVFVTFILTLIIILLDVFVFTHFLEMPNVQTIWWQALLACLYGGITEELMTRLFWMTLLVWLFARITKREKEHIPKSFYYISIFLVAIGFGLGHLPPAIEEVGFSIFLVIRIITLNALLGIWFGYLYWKKGLEYAMVAHLSADFFIHVLFVPIFN